jgi:hypothetical protein
MDSNEFYRSLIVPAPLHAIERKLKGNHVYDKKTVQTLINDYIKKNSELYTTLADFIIEFMNSEVSFREPDKKLVEVFESRLEKLDNRFEYVNQFMIELSQKERNELVKDNLDETIEKLNTYRQRMISIVKKKEAWSKVDALFPSYYDRYLQFLNMIALARAKSKKLSKEESNKMSFVSFMYQVVIYAYLTEKLKEPVMLRRYAEMGMITFEQHKRRKGVRKEIIKSLEDLCPPESQEMVGTSD